MPTESEKNKQLVYSIQTVYNLYWDDKSGSKTMDVEYALRCRETIKVPVSEIVSREYRTDEYDVIPVTALVIENDFPDAILPRLEFIIETNEGVTVEPLVITEPLTVYKVAYLFVLPRGTKGVKNVCITVDDYFAVANDLMFDVMEAPYNYENYLFSILDVRLTEGLNQLSNKVGNLESRVTALGNKTDNLKIVTKTPTFAHIELPKGSGKQNINIEDGVLFYHTSFSYPLSVEATTHNPKIILHGGGRDLTYTLSLTKTTTPVSIDLMTGMIIVYAGVTGEILQQFKLAIPYNGFETLSFENFDDIDNDVLRVTPKGARVV